MEVLERKGSLPFNQRVDTGIYRQERVIEAKRREEKYSKSPRSHRASMEHCREYRESMEGEACERKSHEA